MGARGQDRLSRRRHHGPTATPTPTPTSTPAPAPSGAPGFEAGVVSGSDVLNEAKVTGKLGARVVRVEFSIGEPVANIRSTIAAHAANGTRVLLLAGFHATMPTQAEARNLGNWAREFGPGGDFWAGRSDGRLAVREIEFGNETSYTYQYGDSWDTPSYLARAKEYALRFKDAQEAISAARSGIGLLAQGDDGGTGSANWVNGMFAAVPDLAARVAGWTVHPYGPRDKWKPRIDRLVSQTAARGASAAIPIWITEWGVSTDNGRCLSDNYGWDKCMTYAAAASAVTSSVADIRATYGSRLRALLLYQGRDQLASGSTTNREHYFGALHWDMTDKGGTRRPCGRCWPLVDGAGGARDRVPRVALPAEALAGRAAAGALRPSGGDELAQRAGQGIRVRPRAEPARLALDDGLGQPAHRVGDDGAREPVGEQQHAALARHPVGEHGRVGGGEQPRGLLHLEKPSRTDDAAGERRVGERLRLGGQPADVLAGEDTCRPGTCRAAASRSPIPLSARSWPNSSTPARLGEPQLGACGLAIDLAARAGEAAVLAVRITLARSAAAGPRRSRSPRVCTIVAAAAQVRTRWAAA